MTPNRTLRTRTQRVHYQEAWAVPSIEDDDGTKLLSDSGLPKQDEGHQHHHQTMASGDESVGERKPKDEDFSQHGQPTQSAFLMGSNEQLSSPASSAYSPEPSDSASSSVVQDVPIKFEAEETSPYRQPNRSPLKRHRSQSMHSTDLSGLNTAPRPFKRARGVINHQYVNLLNADIRDASEKHVPHSWPELPASQIGLTFWEPDEKHFFFEALGRLSRHQPHLIAQRIGTKSEMEVLQYIQLLENAKSERSKVGQLDVLAKHDIPAAVELSQECVAALENAADIVSLRQEDYEDSVQSQRRSDGCFLLTDYNLASLVEDSSNAAGGLDPLRFFNIENWLRLPARIFMNATYEEGNWQSISHEPPSIRIDALGDFYSITRAITRKLVAEAIFNAKASNRGRARQTGLLTVRRSHVLLPTQLGLKPQLAGPELFFATCARRLRLSVVDDEREDIDLDDAEPMSYEDVECALSTTLKAKHQAFSESQARSSDDSSSDIEILKHEDGGEEKPNDDAVASGSSVAPSEAPGSVEDYEDSASTADVEDSDAGIEEELQELMRYSAVGIPTDVRSKNAVRLRIRAEREREDLAEAMDLRAGYVEERRIWAEVLVQKPIVPLERVPDPLLLPDSAAAAQRRRLTVDGLIPP